MPPKTRSIRHDCKENITMVPYMEFAIKEQMGDLRAIYSIALLTFGEYSIDQLMPYIGQNRLS
jgi:hypothetical protein